MTGREVKIGCSGTTRLSIPTLLVLSWHTQRQTVRRVVAYDMHS